MVTVKYSARRFTSGSFLILTATYKADIIFIFAEMRKLRFENSNELPTLLGNSCCSVTQSCLTLCDPTDCSMPGFPVLHISPRLLKHMSIELVVPFNNLILCCPLLLLLSIFSSIKVSSNWNVMEHIFNLDLLDSIAFTHFH